MENRIINHTRLNAGKVFRAEMLRNKLIASLYALVFLFFMVLVVYESLQGDPALQAQILSHLLLAFISLIFIFIFPLIAVFSWLRKAKKIYGTNDVELEYRFSDVALRSGYQGTQTTKFEFFNILKYVESKKLLVLITKDGAIAIDKDGFKNQNEYKRVLEYLKRFCK